MPMDRNLTILIAEDSEDDALLLERALRKIGLVDPLRILTDGEEVLQYLRGEGKYGDRAQYPLPGALFTDIKMHRRSGFEVLQWLRDNPQCKIVPTIVLSSSDHVDDVDRAYRLGAHAYLVKPNTPAELEQMLRYTYEFWSRCAKPHNL
jgi:CheY-like chemotaxis protein